MKKKEKQEEEKIPLSERLCRTLDIPPDILPTSGLIEIRGRGLLKLRGGGRILCYTLVCISYCVGAVGIEGRIDKVEFEEEKA